ncbi:hypothetical protein LTR84_010205 [Exophiala bonariae]|uniref:BZIP domain-containing protein n=1 Tax=Exophiala bonariae TaxID=1690606 RepID=A0AAV9MWH7_9EURO|nr:hypothetical protein LTR84_010205 [Exophiala bonariae]
MLESTTSTTTKRKRGRPPVDARHDNWYGVQDPKERKRIQDRLAQRARRNRTGTAPTSSGVRLAQGKDSPQEDESNESSPAGLLKIESHDRELIQVLDESRLIITGPKAQAKVVSWDGVPALNSVGLDHFFLNWPAWSIYAALTKHGLMLGMSCRECIFDSVSTSNDVLPDALQPTPLQMVVPHRRWIDRFPFVRLRDNMILLSSLLDLDAFCGDLFNTASLTLRPSAPSWDPKSWVLGEEFAAKWGYLFR